MSFVLVMRIMSDIRLRYIQKTVRLMDKPGFRKLTTTVTITKKILIPTYY